MIPSARRSPVPALWVIGVLIACGGALSPATAPLGPSPAHATHAEAGDCPHVHDIFDDSFSVCTQKSTGKKCEKGGVNGACQHAYIQVQPKAPFPGFPPFPQQTEGTKCVCVTLTDRTQAIQIPRMADATRTALSFSSVSSALSSVNSSAACAQLGTSIDEIIRAKTSVVGNGAVQFYDTESMKHVDYVISNYGTLHSFATGCGMTKPSVSDVLSALATIKLQINSSFSRLLPQVE